MAVTTSLILGCMITWFTISISTGQTIADLFNIISRLYNKFTDEHNVRLAVNVEPLNKQENVFTKFFNFEVPISKKPSSASNDELSNMFGCKTDPDDKQEPFTIDKDDLEFLHGLIHKFKTQGK
jgi:hypothetical protein